MRRSLTVRGKRLLRELKGIREGLSLTPEDVATRLGWHRTKIYRIEKGDTRLILDDLEELLDLYGVRSPQYEALRQLGRQAWKRGWWLAYTDLYKDGSYFVVENDASKITFQSLHLLPGLLQTREYAHALIRATHPEEAEDAIGRRVEARLRRQELLARETPPEIVALLDEAILRREVGGAEVTRAQLERLVELAARPNVTIRVVPFRAGAHAGLDGEFTLLEFPDPADPPVAYQEGLYGEVFVETDGDLSRYTLAVETVQAAALDPADSLALIQQAAKELR